MTGFYRAWAISLVLFSMQAYAATMTVHVIDVGQGAATLLEFSCGAVLIDTGGEQNSQFKSRDKLMNYLNEFFDRRTDLDRTLALVVLSHPHADHIRGVDELLDNDDGFKVNGVVDNGQSPGLFWNNQRQLQKHGQSIGRYIAVSDQTLPASGSLTGGPLDPFDCVGVDPEFRALAGATVQRPNTWSSTAFKTPNNHSVVLRVDFDEASLLFLGDLQEEGEAALVARYAGTPALDVTYLQASHHGAENGTGAALLAASTPELIFISVGDPNREVSGQTAFGFGHPRKDAIDRFVQLSSLSNRAVPVTIKAASAPEQFENTTISKAIYGTGWDGNIRLFINSDGSTEEIKTD